MFSALPALSAYVRTLALARTLRSRAKIEAFQDRASARLVAEATATIPFYWDRPPRFDDMPIIDKAMQQADFATFNRAGVTLDEAVGAITAGRDTVRGFFVGQSTGTSGNRGRFVISAAERLTWLGTIVAKTMPEAMVRRRRIALALPGFSALYRSAPQGSRIRLAFFDLAKGVEAWRDDFSAFEADAVVAPPKILRRLAEDGRLAGMRPFSGAEVLDPADRTIIETTAGHPVREIYMATEGLFGVACRHGTLHLAEDVMRFEWESVPGSRLVVPVITDLVRRIQPMIRYRMNDLLELSDRPCPCGSAFQAVAQIHGRRDDVFEFLGPNGRVMVTPDIVRNAVVDAHPTITDFRVVQSAAGSIVLKLDEDVPAAGYEAALGALERLFQGFGVNPPIEIRRGIPPRFDRKLRRVERERPPTIPS